MALLPPCWGNGAQLSFACPSPQFSPGFVLCPLFSLGNGPETSSHWGTKDLNIIYMLTYFSDHTSVSIYESTTWWSVRLRSEFGLYTFLQLYTLIWLPIREEAFMFCYYVHFRHCSKTLELGKTTDHAILEPCFTFLQSSCQVSSAVSQSAISC